ncbi:uncharacterized protein LOC127844083 isoform X2 [Dreissena polymorpha]|uniref:uncharacterized protein LOC127844083 isoform X2 n=1 Tax=Dreissena polymorpha TaxID=45954 RepID=UPI002264AF90|nr:uncharacterized protein LOC127844083 isoform X2 [Dreissena polymorpha]
MVSHTRRCRRWRYHRRLKSSGIETLRSILTSRATCPHIRTPGTRTPSGIRARTNRNRNPPTTRISNGSATYRSRFEEATLRRDEYNETLPSRPREPPYEREFEMNGDYRRERGRATDRGRQNGTRYPADNAEKMLAQFDDLVADGQELNPEELTKAVCNKCYNSNMCMNRLGCGHQYCDDCMARMPGSDGPFRDTVRWYFSCPLDNKRTSEAKVVRTDPFGRRLEIRPSSR